MTGRSPLRRVAALGMPWSDCPTAVDVRCVELMQEFEAISAAFLAAPLSAPEDPVLEWIRRAEAAGWDRSRIHVAMQNLAAA